MQGMFPISGVNSPDEEHSDPFELNYAYELESNSDINATPADSSGTSEDSVSASNYDDSISTTDSEDSVTTSELENSASEDQIRKLKSIVAKLAKGFDASSFPVYIQHWIPRFAGILFPGSYAHLVVILLLDFDLMEGVQHNMYQWLVDRYPVLPSYKTYALDGLDGGLFISELRTLRKLLAPLRGDNSRPIHWIGSRIAEPSATYREVKQIMKTIESFKEDLLGDIQGPNDDRTIYDPRGRTAEYNTEACIREYRMDACRASLGWGEFVKSDLHLSSLHRRYKKNMIENDPEKARNGGFLPPLVPAVPGYRHIDPHSGRIPYCDWPQEELKNTILDLILKIAVWLGLTRNAQAVTTFCDVVRAFSLKRPSATTDESRISLLYSFTALRISCEGITSGIATPESDDGDRGPFNDNNPRFLNDVSNQFNLDFHGVRAISEQSLPQLELNDFFHTSDNSPGPLPSVSMPYRLDHSRIPRGRTQVYRRRSVLNALYEETVDTTLSSKPIRKKSEISGEEPAEDADGEEHPPSTPASQPIPIPERRSSWIYDFANY